MTLPWPAYRSVSRFVIRTVFAVVAVVLGGAACGSSEPATPLPRDLMRDLSSAHIQPAASADVARLDDVMDAGGATPVLLTAAPARLTWPVRFPARAEFEASVAIVTPSPPTAGVTVRIGLSDDRAYEELARMALGPSVGTGIAWQPIRIDLSAYSGWQWSLFYRPSRIAWNLIVAADPTPGGTVAWRTLRVQRR